ncbi:MAG: L,D-transpeptidase [Puniceicoccales bacterium]|nr:L,D-transpeptidase [Puniceicoccales bacterium]
MEKFFAELIRSPAELGAAVCGPVLRVSIGRRILEILSPQGVLRKYTVSTGRAPPSCREGSFGTPSGWHAVVEKYGDGLAEGAVLIGRRPTGKFFWEYGDWQKRSYVTTRILRLRGLEEGRNVGIGPDGHSCDSYGRHIYIHGNCPGGMAGTGGCIALRTRDMAELYDLCSVGTAVFIDL